MHYTKQKYFELAFKWDKNNANSISQLQDMIELMWWDMVLVGNDTTK